MASPFLACFHIYVSMYLFSENFRKKLPAIFLPGQMLTHAVASSPSPKQKSPLRLGAGLLHTLRMRNHVTGEILQFLAGI